MSWAEVKKAVDWLCEDLGYKPGNMRKFEASPVDETSIALKFLEPAESYIEDVLYSKPVGVIIRYSSEKYPENPDEGTLVIDNTNLGAYENTPYTVSGLTAGTTYYFSAFPYTAIGAVNTTGGVNRCESSPLKNEACTVTVVVDDTAAFTQAEIKCVNETKTTSETKTVTPQSLSVVFNVPEGDSYHIEFGEVTGYAKPSNSETYVAVGGGTRTVTGNYYYSTAVLTVQCLANTVVTCTQGDKVLTATATGSSVQFEHIPPGTWAVTGMLNGEATTSASVNITSNSGEYTAILAKIVTWAGGTDEEIVLMVAAADAGYIDLTDYWSVGQERTVHLSAMSGGGIAEQDTVWVLMHEGQYPLNGDKIDTPVGELKVGSVIQLNENGSPVDYIVVHQGLPSEMYDESCNGTWVVRQTIAENRAWDSTNNDYQNSDIHAYLNLQYLSIFDEATKSAIKQAKIPFVNGAGNSPVASGSDGLNCKIFLLSSAEVGSTTNTLPNDDGAKLYYFTDNNSRIAMFNGTASNWWLRSPYTSNSTNAGVTSSAGGFSTARPTTQSGVRPAFILDPTFTVQAYPTANFVVGMKDCLNESRQMNTTNTNAGGWNACAMRTFLNGDFKNAIPSSLLPMFKQMVTIAANGQGETAIESVDTFALFAETEIFASPVLANVTAEKDLFQIEWYETKANRIKKVNGSAEHWWERSPASTSSDEFCRVFNNGNPDWYDANDAIGVSPFGCI